MKILHTGDWHIGKRLLRKDLYDDQVHVLNQMIDYIRNNEVDVVIIAGDLYDTTQPSKEAMALVNETLRTINIELKKPILIISGNHDSQSRLSYASDWFKAMDVSIHTSFESAFEPVTIGDVDFYLVPYFDVLESCHYFDDESIETHHDVYEHIVSKVNMHMNNDRKNIFVGHLFVRGGTESESERTLFRGLNSDVHPSVFETFDHVLLGHLHHPFAIDHDKIYYSGSLVKYSFSEAKQPKGFRVLDLETDESKFIPFELMRDCIVFEGSYQDVIDGKVEDLLGIEKNTEAFYQFVLDGLAGVPEPMSRIQQVYPNALELKHKRTTKDENHTMLEALSGDHEVFAQFLDNYLDDALRDKATDIFNRHFKEDMNETD